MGEDSAIAMSTLPETLADDQIDRLKPFRPTAGSRLSSRSLTLPLDKSLLRGTPWRMLLRKLGRNLRPPENGMVNVDQKLYALSREVVAWCY